MLTEQEKIREGLQEFIFESWDKSVKSTDLAWDILFYLYSHNVVIKVDSEMPEIKDNKYKWLLRGWNNHFWRQGQLNYKLRVGEGYVKTIPLVEVK